jgi:hypothetical protein
VQSTTQSNITTHIFLISKSYIDMQVNTSGNNRIISLFDMVMLATIFFNATFLDLLFLSFLSKLSSARSSPAFPYNKPLTPIRNTTLNIHTLEKSFASLIMSAPRTIMSPRSVKCQLAKRRRHPDSNLPKTQGAYNFTPPITAPDPFEFPARTFCKEHSLIYLFIFLVGSSKFFRAGTHIPGLLRRIMGQEDQPSLSTSGFLWVIHALERESTVVLNNSLNTEILVF